MNEIYSPKVSLKPFVGTEYGKSEYKILILGESTYDKIPEEDSIGIRTAKTVDRFIAEPHNHNYRVFRDCLDVLCGSNCDANMINKFAFYNYIQTVLDDNKNRPTKDMWKSAEMPFLEVVENLDPDFILVIGKTVYNNLPYNKANDKSSEIVVDDIKMWTYTYWNNDKTIDVCAVYHTSYWNRINLDSKKLRNALLKSEYSKYLG